MLRFIFIIFLFAISGGIIAQNSNENQLKPKKEDFLWIQKVLDNWNYTCLNDLKIAIKPLPWIIFYDSSSAWHLNADQSMLPSFTKTNDSVTFAGVWYQLVRVNHQKGIWVPDRKPVPLESVLVSTMPYAGDTKTFFIAPLPSLFHKLAQASGQEQFVDFIFLGGNIHELTHTRQLPFVLPQLLKLQKASRRESLNDNTVENEFSKDERYKQLFSEENRHLWNAAFAISVDSCRIEIEQAFKLRQIRMHEFFTGANQPLGEADEIFLSLEGSAMWAQYRIMFKNTPNPISRELLSWIVQQAGAWSQERGLVMFLLIDKFDSNWKALFFENQLPNATDYLQDLLK